MNIRFISMVLIVFALGSSSSFAQTGDHPGQVTDDSSLISAIKGHKKIAYLEAGNLTVTNLLPDDTSGLPHQKWQASLSDGSHITVVYNSDMGLRVPIHVGDKFDLGGQYIPTGNSGIMHWLHDDPKHIHPDGYVFLNGVVYGDTDHEDN